VSERFERELLADGAGGGGERHASRFLGVERPGGLRVKKVGKTLSKFLSGR
jgi:hypothetical protein